MRVAHLQPAEKIAGFVERILAFENDEVIHPYALPLFANGQPTLLFQSVKGSINNHQTSYLTLFGQTIIPETLYLPTNFDLIAYFLKPFALTSLFDVTAQELTDRPIDLYLLEPVASIELQEKLLHAATTEERMVILDNYLYKLINASKTEDKIIRYASHFIANNPGKNSLVTVQKELHVTERTFQRMFEKNIGVGPNLYRRICQFNAAFQQLNSRKYHKLSDIAFLNGYADQSHYIRAFKEFTRITPGDYFNENRSSGS